MRVCDYNLEIKAVTWQKDSHGLFDYEVNKITNHNRYEIALQETFIFFYRSKDESAVTYTCSNKLSKHTPANGDLLCCFQIYKSPNENQTQRIRFYTLSEIEAAEQLICSEAPKRQNKSQQIYIIVRSMKTRENQNKGYKLNPGHILKMGRAQYKITNAQMIKKQKNLRFWGNQKMLVVDDAPKEGQCRYCLLGEKDFLSQNQQDGYFLCSPCKCQGTCIMVHFKCLQKWSQSKIKKQTVGGTLVYSLQRFFCEVCLSEYPRYIKKSDVIHELMPIEFPEGEHLVLESKEEHNNNLIMIRDTHAEGIKIGRGQDADIRLGDISVSRTHAKIIRANDGYYVFDNRSKFGTLIHQQPLIMNLQSMKKGVQIGRTVITFEKKKINQNKK